MVKLTKVRYIFAGIVTSMMLALGSVVPGVTSIVAYASDYSVTLVPSSFKVTVTKDFESLTLSQSDMREMVKTGSIYIDNGAPLSIPGSLADISQLNIVTTKDWELYKNGSDDITQSYLNGLKITVKRSDFENGILGTATTKNIPLSIVVFDKKGKVFGTGRTNLLATLDIGSETVIDGKDFNTIITEINALAEKTTALKNDNSYSELSEQIKGASETLDTEDVAAAILSVQAQLKEEKDKETKDTKKIELLEQTLSSLTELKKSCEDIEATQDNARAKLNALKEEYNKVQTELDNLHKTSGNTNIGYAGIKDGKSVVYINGQAFTYALPGEDYIYTDSMGDHSVVKYHADQGFDFFINISGVNIINSDGSTTLYEDTLTETLVKADAMLAEIGKEIVGMQTELNDFYTAMKNLMGDSAVKGATTGDVLDSVTTSVKSLITNYNTVKADYVAAMKAIDPSMSESDILKLQKSGVVEKVTALKGEAQKVQDQIQKALTGKAVTDADRQSLETLKSNVSNLVTKLDTDEAALKALYEALGAEDTTKAIAAAKELAVKAKKLETENATLTSKNKELAKQYADTKTALTKAQAKPTTTDTSKTAAAQVKSLQNKVATLEGSNASLTAQLASAKAANKGKTTVTPVSSSNSATVTTLQNKVSELTNKLAEAQKKQASTVTGTAPSSALSSTSSSSASSSLKDTGSKKTSSKKDAENEKDEEEEQKATVEITDATSGNGIEPISGVVETASSGVIDGEFDLKANGQEVEVEETESTELDEEQEPEEESGALNPKAIIFICALVSLILGLGGYILYSLLKKRPNKIAELDSLMEEEEEEAGFGDDDFEDEGDEFEDDGPEIDDSADEEFTEEVADEGYDISDDDDDEEFIAS